MTAYLQVISQRLEELQRRVSELEGTVAELKAKERVVAARGFVVEDAHGRRRVELATVPFEDGAESPWLGLFDAEGKVRACVGAGGQGRHGLINGPWLEFYNSDGQSLIEVEAANEGALIRLFDSNGKPRSVLNVDLSGRPVLLMYDGNGHLRLCVEVASTGEPGLVMYDAEADPRLYLTVEGQRPSIRFRRDSTGPWVSATE